MTSLICHAEKFFCKHLWSFLNCKTLFLPLQKGEKVLWPNGALRIWACWQNPQQVVRGKITNGFNLKSILTCNTCLIWEILSTHFLNKSYLILSYWFITYKALLSFSPWEHRHIFQWCKEQQDASICLML